MGLFGHSRTFKDSGELNLINASVVAVNGVLVFDVDARFKPYDYATITNSSSSDIKVGTNYKNDFNFLVMAGDTRTLHRRFEDLRFKNIGAGQIEINEIQATIQHSGEAEKNKIKGKLQVVSQVAMLRNLF